MMDSVPTGGAGDNGGNSSVYPNEWLLYGASALNGIAGTTLIITSLSMISDLSSGSSAGSAAFVFGAIAFADKMTSGVAIFLFESYLPTADIAGDNRFYKIVLVSTASVSSVILFLDTLWVAKSGRVGLRRRKRPQTE